MCSNWRYFRHIKYFLVLSLQSTSLSAHVTCMFTTFHNESLVGKVICSNWRYFRHIKYFLALTTPECPLMVTDCPEDLLLTSFTRHLSLLTGGRLTEEVRPGSGLMINPASWILDSWLLVPFPRFLAISPHEVSARIYEDILSRLAFTSRTAWEL